MIENQLKYIKNILAFAEKEKSSIKIPNVLIERFKPYGTKRFLKVEPPTLNDKKSGKAAIEKNWPKYLYEPDDPEFQKWLSVGGNYGICAGQGIIIIETDTTSTTKKFAEYNTLTIKSGSGRGKHFIFRSDVSENGVLLDKKGKNVGNVQVKNKYIVGANSRHYSGGTYTIINDAEIQWLSQEEINEVFKEEIKWANQKRLAEFEAESKEEKERTGVEIPIKELINLSDFHVLANGEYQGEHPLHGSETGQNFCVNTEKNVWHCFRCNSGGGALMWLAVESNILKCHEAQPDALIGKKFMQAVKVAAEQGYNMELYDEDINPDVERFFEPDGKKKKFVAALVAKELMNENTYVTRKKDEMMFRYMPKKGIYMMFAETHIKEETRRKLGKHTSIARQNEVVNFIKVSTYEDLEDPSPEYVVLKNGIFNIFTKGLLPFDPKYFILNALNVEYQPDADCPKFKKFLSEVLVEGDIQTVREYIGYCFYRKYHIQKAIMFIGEGANGKSTLQEVIRELLNSENVSSEPLHTLIVNRFSIGQLYGKLANICADLPAIALKSTGLFKQLMGDTVSAEFKFKERFNFRNYAKLIFSCNQIPQTSDETTAFWRRWIIINFPNQFTDENPDTDKNLLEKLTTADEISGIFNWTIEGLQGLLKMQRFSGSKTTEETREQYIKSSNPAQAFVEEKLTTDPNGVLTKDEVYNAFVEYCKTNNLPTITKSSLSHALPQFITVEAGHTRRLGKNTRSWKGIKFIDSNAGEQLTQLTQHTPNLYSYKSKNNFSKLNIKKVCAPCASCADDEEFDVEDAEISDDSEDAEEPPTEWEGS